MEQALPIWVTDADGLREAFEADRISQSLFAVTEALGAPNAFLARELADGVLHFLGLERLGETVRAEQIAECVAKVIRELGHPALARAYELRHAESSVRNDSSGLTVRFEREQTPEEVVRACLEQYSLQLVYARDLASAQAEGLLMIEDLDAPRALPAAQLEMSSSGDGWETLARHVVLEGLEWAWARESEAATSAWLSSLQRSLRARGSLLEVHVHVTQPPAWARALGGPLFAAGEACEALDARDVLGRLAKGLDAPACLAWHVPAQQVIDFDPVRELCALCANKGWTPALVFDRPKRAIRFSRGIDREHPALLGSVRLHLPTLLGRPGLGGNSDAFLGKLPSFVRMAVSAGVQKRNYLRRAAPELGRGFMLERARWRVVPCGLDDVVRHFLKQGMAESRLSLELGRTMLESMRSVLEKERRRTGLSLVLAPDVPADAADVCHSDDDSMVALRGMDASKLEWLRERTAVVGATL